MRTITHLFAIAVLTLLAVGSGAVASALDARVEAEASPSLSADASEDRPYGPRWVFDLGYDDSWVENVPDVIGGFRVIHVSTPKSRACLYRPIVLLQSEQPTLEEYLATPLDVSALRAEIASIPGAPSNIRLSFGSGAVDGEMVAAREADWNRSRMERSCHEPSRKLGN